MKRIFRTLALLLHSLSPFLFLGFSSHVVLAKPSDATVIFDVNVIPMTTPELLKSRSVVLRNGRIEQILPKRPQIPGARYVNGYGKYLIPGLIDAHVHIAHLLKPDYAPVQTALLIANGVTSARNMMGGPLHLKLKEEIESGKVLGPRLHVVSSAFIGPGFLPAEKRNPLGKDYDCDVAKWGCVVFTPAGVRYLAAKFKSEGYESLKSWDYLTRPLYLALIQAAKELDMKVVGHIPNDFVQPIPEVMPKEVLQGNYQHSIEHLTNFEFAIESKKSPLYENPDVNLLVLGAHLLFPEKAKFLDLVKDLKKSRTFQVPTLVNYSSFNDSASGKDLSVLPGPAFLGKCWVDKQIKTAKQTREDLKKWENFEGRNLILEGQKARIQFVGALHRAGVSKFVLGSDNGFDFVVPGFSAHDELQLFVEAGFSPFEALKTGTINAAALLENPNLGVIKEGAIADLVLLNGNPLKDIQATRKISAVVRDGQFLERAELNRILIGAQKAAELIPCK